MHSTPSRRRWRVLVAGLVLLPVLGGCQTVTYYAHSALGQWRVLQAREPVDQLLQDLEPRRDDDPEAAQLYRRLAYSQAGLAGWHWTPAAAIEPTWRWNAPPWSGTCSRRRPCPWSRTAGAIRSSAARPTAASSTKTMPGVGRRRWSGGASRPMSARWPPIRRWAGSRIRCSAPSSPGPRPIWLRCCSTNSPTARSGRRETWHSTSRSRPSSGGGD